MTTTTLRFAARFREPILSGAKPFTLRGGAARNYALGDQLELCPDRGPAFATAQCVFRASVVFAAAGIARVLDPKHLADGDRLARIFAQAEQGMPQAGDYLNRIALLDGFPSWADFHAWHLDHGQSVEGRCTREVIGWSGVKAAGEEGEQPAEIPTELEPLYYAEGGTVFKRPVDRTDDGGKPIATSMGFRVCQIDENLGDVAAAHIAKALCAYEAQAAA